METKDYSNSITVDAGPQQAFEKIAEVNGWWAKNFNGQALKKEDHFRVDFGTTWVEFGITEAIPAKKIVWHVNDCHLPWLNDKTEWNGTEVVWDLAPESNGTRITMTHKGLYPGVECFEACNAGWNEHIISLASLIKSGTGTPS